MAGYLVDWRGVPRTPETDGSRNVPHAVVYSGRNVNSFAFIRTGGRRYAVLLRSAFVTDYTSRLLFYRVSDEVQSTEIELFCYEPDQSIPVPTGASGMSVVYNQVNEATNIIITFEGSALEHRDVMRTLKTTYEDRVISILVPVLETEMFVWPNRRFLKVFGKTL